MNKLFSTIIAITAMFTLAGCDALEQGYDISDQSLVDDKIVPCIIKHIGEDATVYSIDLASADPLSKKTREATVVYTPAGGTEVASKKISLLNDTSRDWNVFSWDRERTPDTGVKLKEINFSQIGHFLESAAAVMAAEGQKFNGIKSYDIIAGSGDPAGIVHKFSPTSRDKTSMTASGGKVGTETSYYYFPFEGHTDGSVVYAEE